VEGFEGLIEQAPGAAAVIVMAYLFLRDKKSLQDIHYQTIKTLFSEADATNKELLGQLKETTLVMGQCMRVNEQALTVFEKINSNLEKRGSDSAIDSNAIKRALLELKEKGSLV